MLKRKVEACYRGNLEADKGLFDPALKIEGVERWRGTLGYMYGIGQGRDGDELVKGIGGVCAGEVEVQNSGDGGKLFRSKRIQIHNLRASMTACYAWTEHSLDRKMDERYSKIEKRAFALLEALESVEDDGPSPEVRSRELALELDVLLKRLERIMQGTVKREHGRLYGRKGN